jgi:hypothetical protein
MVVRNSRKKVNAMMRAAKARKAGLEAKVFKKKEGYGISTTRKKK